MNDETAGGVFVLSELYRPELTSTGYYISEIAEALASYYHVTALCSQPTYSSRGILAPASEQLNGVSVRRVWTPIAGRGLGARLVEMLGFTLGASTALLGKLRPGNVVLSVTNPPILPVAAALLARLRGARFVVLVHDVYPELLVTTGVFRKNSTIIRILNRVSAWLYRSADRIIVLGRDMKEVILAKAPGSSARISIVENWADLDEIRVEPRQPQKPFVLQHAGNMGRTHDVATLVEAARALGTDVRIDFVGDGAQLQHVFSAAATSPNIRVSAYRPRGERSASLGDCDAALISFRKGMSGLSVPSRMYNIMASGRPIIAACDPDSELGRVITEFRAGWVVPPGDVASLVTTIRSAAADRAEAQRRGLAGRHAAETHYTKAIALNKMLATIKNVDGQCSRSQ